LILIDVFGFGPGFSSKIDKSRRGCAAKSPFIHQWVRFDWI